MTTRIPQRSVLVIGASQRILDDSVAALRDLGYTAQQRRPLTRRAGTRPRRMDDSDHAQAVNVG